MQWYQLISLFKPKTFGTKQFVVSPNSETHEILFVCQGLLRFFYIDDDGAEANKAFIAENEFVCPVALAVLKTPIFYGIQAIEKTVLLSADYNEFILLCEREPIFERIGRKINESVLVQKELRARSFLQKDATQRYLEFINLSPHLAGRIPQYHVASYLGVTEVSLSRIRRSLVRRTNF